MSPPLPAAVSLAFLKASWDQSHADYIDVFTPLVLSTLDTAPEEGFSLSQNQDTPGSSSYYPAASKEEVARPGPTEGLPGESVDVGCQAS